MIVTSFYTKNTEYEKEAQNLILSCKKFDVPFDIIGIDSLGSWEKNCAFKPQFLLNQLDKHQKPLVWLDADAVLMQAPTLFYDLNCDIALYSPENLPDHHPSKFLSGTLYIQNTKEARSFLKLWDEECSKAEGWDQIALRNVLLHLPIALTVGLLPQSYCAIFDKTMNESPVIMHYQASRLFKKGINREVVPFWNDNLFTQNDRQNFSKNH